LIANDNISSPSLSPRSQDAELSSAGALFRCRKTSNRKVSSFVSTASCHGDGPPFLFFAGRRRGQPCSRKVFFLFFFLLIPLQEMKPNHFFLYAIANDPPSLFPFPPTGNHERQHAALPFSPSPILNEELAFPFPQRPDREVQARFYSSPRVITHTPPSPAFLFPFRRETKCGVTAF